MSRGRAGREEEGSVYRTASQQAGLVLPNPTLTEVINQKRRTLCEEGGDVNVMRPPCSSTEMRRRGIAAFYPALSLIHPTPVQASSKKRCLEALDAKGMCGKVCRRDLRI